MYTAQVVVSQTETLPRKKAVLNVEIGSAADHRLSGAKGPAFTQRGCQAELFRSGFPGLSIVPSGPASPRPFLRPTDQPVRWVSAAVISVATAVLIWAGANGFEITTLSGTPFDDQSWMVSPVM